MQAADDRVSAGARAVAWGGMLCFFASLAYFLYSYAVAYGRPASEGSTARGVLLDVLLFSLFALHHSVFARDAVRARVARVVPSRLERSAYVWVASILFVAVCAVWQPIPGVAWQVQGGARWLLLGGQAAGVWLTLRSAAMIDILELSGVRQLSPAPRRDLELTTTGPYGWVRHPIYSGWLLVVFCVPIMTMTRLVFALTSSAYLLLAIPFEERSMRAAAAAYDEYVRRVRWKLVPGIYLLAALAYACGGDPPGLPTAPTPTVTLPAGGACGTLGLGPTAILSGTDCTPGTSAVVSLNSRAADGANEGSCSGTIIAPRRILTAAHCLEDTAVVRVWLGVGDQIETRSFVSHPQYAGVAGRAEDVAIITMDRDLPRSPIPLLLSRDARVGESAVIAGWGRDLNNVSATLRAGVTTVTGVTPTAIQTIFASNVSSVCSGDSGGPILLQEGGVWAVGGVISATTEAACNTGTNFYANIRNSIASSFIVSQAPEAVRR